MPFRTLSVTRDVPRPLPLLVALCAAGTAAVTSAGIHSPLDGHFTMLICSAISALLGHVFFATGSTLMRASRSLAQYGLPVHRMGIGDDGVSEMSMPTSVAGSGFVASAAFDSGSEYDAGSSTVAGVSKTLRLPAREFREVLDECARTEWTRPIHNTVPALPLIPPPPWPNAPLFRFMLHGTYGVPVTRDGLLWTQYVFGAGMYLFFVVAGFYDGSIVFSFAFGFLCLVILEEVSESAKMRSVHATRHINIVAPLWLAHTLAFVSIVLGFVVSIDLGRYFDEHRTGAVFGSVLPVACVLSVIAPVLLLATAPFCHPAQSIEIGLPVCSGLALATLLGLALHPSTPVGLVPFLQQASGTHGTIFYLLSPLATLTSIYSTVKAMRMRASWAALCSLLLIGNLKIHSFHLPQLIALARDAAAAASVTNMTFLEGRRPDLVYNASAHSETLLQTAEFRRIRTRSALDDASIATAVVAVLFYIVAIRRDVAQRYQFSTARFESESFIGSPPTSPKDVGDVELQPSAPPVPPRSYDPEDEIVVYDSAKKLSDSEPPN